MPRWLFFPQLGFSPTQIANLHRWYDGSDSTSMTFSSGSIISQWNDKSGNAQHLTQSNSIKRPSFLSASLGVDFGTSQYYMTMPEINLTGNVTAFAVCRYRRTDNGSGYGYIMGHTSNRQWRINYPSTNTFNWYDGSNLAGSTAVSHGYQNRNTLYEIKRSGTGSNGVQYYTDGVATGTNTVAGAFLFDIVGGNLGTNQYEGWIQEIIIYNRALNDTERQQVESYLMSKWYIWNPLALSPLFWLDCNDTSKMAIGSGKVSSFTDKGSAAKVFSQGTAANQPTFTANVFNNANGVLFDGTDDFMQGNTALSLGDQTVTMVSVIRPTGLAESVWGAGFISEITNASLANGDFILSVGENTGAGNNEKLQFTYKYGTDNTDRYLSSNGSITANNNFKVFLTRTVGTDTKTIEINNVANTPTTGTIGGGWGTPGLQIGRTYPGTQNFYYQGYLMEQLIFLGTLSAENKTLLNTYFNYKHGL